MKCLLIQLFSLAIDKLKVALRRLCKCQIGLSTWFHCCFSPVLAGSKNYFVVLVGIFPFSPTTCIRCKRCVIFDHYDSSSQIEVVTRRSAYCFISKDDPIAGNDGMNVPSCYLYARVRWFGLFQCFLSLYGVGLIRHFGCLSKSFDVTVRSKYLPILILATKLNKILYD